MHMNFWERPSDAQPSDQMATEDIEFNEDQDIYRAQFDYHARPPSIAVIETLETALEADTHELPPLYEVIDPDALDKVFDQTQTGQLRNDASVQFTFEGHPINVHSYGVVEVEHLGGEDV